MTMQMMRTRTIVMTMMMTTTMLMMMTTPASAATRSRRPTTKTMKMMMITTSTTTMVMMAIMMIIIIMMMTITTIVIAILTAITGVGFEHGLCLSSGLVDGVDDAAAVGTEGRVRQVPQARDVVVGHTAQWGRAGSGSESFVV